MSEAISKKTEALLFINSNKFGIHTWTTIFNFGINTHDIILTIQLYSTLFERLDKGDLLTNNNQQEISRIKQQFVLDAILKLEILIESTLVLVHSLSIEYHTVAKNMTYYDSALVESIIREISINKKIRNYKYNMRRVLGLPNLKHLSLSTKEKELLNSDFESFELTFLDVLKTLVSFYDKFRIVYGKSKHGLAFITGGSSNSTNEDGGILGNSVLNCYSRIYKEDKMPKGTIQLSTISSNPPLQYPYFNFISVISFNTKLIEEINSILSILKELISFICTNHQSYALNCGKGYLPYKKTDNKFTLITSRELRNENEQQIFKSIWDKNFPKMYIPEVENVVNMTYTNPQIAQSLTKDTITNILIPETVKIDNNPDKYPKFSFRYLPSLKTTLKNIYNSLKN
jgi:hypothetical protein